MILINSSLRTGGGIFQSFLPNLPPIGIGYLLAVARDKNIKVKFIDERIEKDTLCLVQKYVKEIKPPYIFGFSVLTEGIKSAITVSSELKKLYPDSIICFGGIHPTAMPEEILSYNHIDIVFRGEAENSLTALYKCIKTGNDFKYLENISYKTQEGQIVHNNRHFIDDLNNLPLFPYDLFATKQYNLGFIVSSRGCPHRCIFCSNRVTTGRQYRHRNIDLIMQEIEILYYQYSKTRIDFFDDNLLVNKPRAYSLLAEIRKKGFDKKIKFAFQTRGDDIDYQLLKEMYQTGFRFVNIGIETGSDRMMKIIKKDETVRQIIDAIQIAKEIGFYISTTFMFGLPEETAQDRADCLKLAKKLDIGIMKFNNAIPYPGTEFYQIAKNENRLNVQGLYENFNSVGTICDNPFKKTSPPYVPKGSNQKDIEKDILLGYLISYLNFNKIKKVFSNGQGWFNPGENSLEIIKRIPALMFAGMMLGIKFCWLIFYMFFKKNRK